MTMSEHNRAWWREPMVWLIAGLPASAVVAGLATVMIASHKADSLVSADYSKQGMTVDQNSARYDLAKALGLSAAMTMTPDGEARVDLTGNSEVRPDRLKLTFVHPTLADQDVLAEFSRVESDIYVARIGDRELGRRQLILEPEDGAWRLAGVLEHGWGGTVALTSGNTDSSTHP